MHWLQPTIDLLHDLDTRDQLPHALMLSGRSGIGKRHVAFDLAVHCLKLDIALPQTFDETSIQAPDFYWLAPAPDKRQISIDQVRALGQQLTLSAHGGRKVAIVDTADKMTLAAANALLKTLEEPAGDCVMIILADDLSRIPATIVSRCAQYRISTPAHDDALQWLQQQEHPQDDADTALLLHNGAPVAAANALADGSFKVLAEVRDDIGEILGGNASPLTAASEWRKYQFSDVLDALRVVALQWVYPNTHRMGSTSRFRDYVIDSRDAFCYLDKVNRVRRMNTGSFNPELALDTLAAPWQNGLAGFAGEIVSL